MFHYNDSGDPTGQILVGGTTNYTGDMVFKARAGGTSGSGGAAIHEYLRLRGNERELVVNQDGLDQDFRVESDTNANALFVDASANAVGFGTTSSLVNDASNEGLYYLLGGSLTLASNTESLQINRNNTGGNNRTNIGLYNNGTKRGEIGTYGSADGMYFYAGSTIDALRLTTGEAIFNDGSGDIDFRVESDTNPHALYVDAGNGNVGINTSATGSTLAELTVGKAGDFPVLKISRTDASYTSGVLALGDGNGTAVNVAVWRGNQNDYSAGGNYLNLHGYQGVSIASANATAGSGTMGVFVSPSATVINEDGADYDFRVESDSNDHMLFVDAGNDRVGIKNSAPQHPLSVNGTTQILAGANNTGSIANGATADVITSVPRGFSYVNVSYSSTATGGLLLLLYTTTASTTIVSTISDQSGGAFSASVSGRALRATNSSGSAATLYASCMTLAWGTGD
jgi:hypothetical protein